MSKSVSGVFRFAPWWDLLAKVGNWRLRGSKEGTAKGPAGEKTRIKEQTQKNDQPSTESR